VTQTDAPRTPGGYRANLDALKRAQKPARGTAAYSRLVNRPLGRRVAAAAATTGMTPNVATVISACLSGTGLLLVALVEPTPLLGLAVGLLLAAGYVMDSVDGQLARLAGSGSRSGEWFDHTVDCFKTTALHLVVLVSFYRFPPVEHDWVLLVPLVFTLVQTVTYFELILMPYLRKGAGAPPPVTDTSAEHPLRTWVLLPTDYGTLLWSFALLGLPVAFVSLYSFLALVNVLALAWGLRKWWHELRALDAGSAGAAA
jgi:phosphatidylglycerophosphate synthase